LAGIQNSHQGPVSGAEFHSSNLWQGPVDTTSDTWYMVYAGQLVDTATGNPTTPAVILQTTVPTPDGYSLTITTVGTFVDASADGPLTITGVSGKVMQLQTPSGQKWTFALDTHQFA
jgi:hypothetical protein